MRPKIELNSWEPFLADLRGRLAENVRGLRGERQLSQEQLALEAGIDRTLVSKIERQRANPSLEVLAKICVVLKVPIARLFEDGNSWQGARRLPS
jgi:transcriptional regulator with XRE-family HTH domain